MDPKDELLAKLAAIDAETHPPEPEPELKPVSPPSPSKTPETVSPEISTDDFLAKLEALDQATRPEPSPIPSVLPAPPAPTSTSRRKPGPARTASSQPGTPKISPSNGQPAGGTPFPQNPSRPAAAPAQPYASFPNVIERLKQFTQGQLAAHAAQNQAKAKRAQEIARAQAWLDQLDPLSDDGFWFEQFAESYESRIQAALDFLDPGRAK